jgi:hypothetical protein
VAAWFGRRDPKLTIGEILVSSIKQSTQQRERTQSLSQKSKTQSESHRSKGTKSVPNSFWFHFLLLIILSLAIKFVGLGLYQLVLALTSHYIWPFSDGTQNQQSLSLVAASVSSQSQQLFIHKEWARTKVQFFKDPPHLQTWAQLKLMYIYNHDITRMGIWQKPYLIPSIYTSQGMRTY